MLDRVEQCDEYSVHLPGPPGAPMDQDQSERISDPQQVVSSTDRPGTRYLLARRQGVHRASAVRSKALARAELLRPGLDGLHRGCEINPPISGQETLVTLVFLVPRASTTAFVAALEAARCSGFSSLIATGPWPPYHFTSPPAEFEPAARVSL